MRGFLAAAVEEVVSWEQKEEWLREFGLLHPDKTVCERRCAIFSNMQLGPGALGEKGEYFRALLPFEEKLAAT